MAKYSYQAVNSIGKVENGKIDASNEIEARVKLKAINLTITQLSEVRALQQKQTTSTKKVKSKDLQIFTRQFSTLINAGIPIVDAMKMLGESGHNPVLKEAINTVRESIESGKRLGDAMAQFPGVFDRLYVNMIRAGEEAGILDGILDRLAIYLEKSQKIRNQVKGALVYPIAIVFVAILVIVGMLVFIIPKFEEMYNNAGKKLPGLTQIVINISQFLIHKFHILLIGIFGIVYLIYMFANTPEGKKELDRIFIRVPVFGDLIQKSSIARMSRTLATLLSSGVNVIDTLEIAARTSGNAVIEDALVRAKEAVTEGRPLASPLAKEKMIPEMVTQMIAIGEKSGMMDAMFAKIADFYEDDVEVAVKAMTSLIEPILMVGLGGTIAFIILAMYLPIFDMANLSSK